MNYNFALTLMANMKESLNKFEVQYVNGCFIITKNDF